jgi:hypothetical protein
MSDIPPPPGPPPPPPPPPPGANLPPGYTAYQPGAPTGVGPLKGVRKLGTAIVVLVAICAVATLVSPLLIPQVEDSARDYLAGRISEDDFVSDWLTFSAIGGLVGLLTLAAAVITMIWMYRMASNHRQLRRQGTWAPLWAVFGWFLPPCVIYAIPMLMFRELWKASDPDVPLGSDQWKQSRVSPVVIVWWVIFGLAPLVFIAANGADQFGGGFGADTEDAAQNIIDTAGTAWPSALVNVAAAAAYVVLVRQVTARHARLIRES